jgi:hypothetical protein
VLLSFFLYPRKSNRDSNPHPQRILHAQTILLTADLPNARTEKLTIPRSLLDKSFPIFSDVLSTHDAHDALKISPLIHIISQHGMRAAGSIVWKLSGICCRSSSSGYSVAGLWASRMLMFRV